MTKEISDACLFSRAIRLIQRNHPAFNLSSRVKKNVHATNKRYFLFTKEKLIDQKENYFSTHMQDLQEVTHDLHYENFRAQRLQSSNPSDQK